MGDPKRGLYGKFSVERVDGSSEPGKKHHDCEYYVLDLDHDKHAPPALEAYAASCEKEYPLLARDLRKKALAMRDRFAEGVRHVCGVAGFTPDLDGPCPACTTDINCEGKS